MDTSPETNSYQEFSGLKRRIVDLLSIGIHHLPIEFEYLQSELNNVRYQLYLSIWPCECSKFPILISSPSYLNDSPFFEINSPDHELFGGYSFPLQEISELTTFTVRLHINISNTQDISRSDLSTIESLISGIRSLDLLKNIHHPSEASIQSHTQTCVFKNKFTKQQEFTPLGYEIASFEINLNLASRISDNDFLLLHTGTLHNRLVLVFPDGAYTFKETGCSLETITSTNQICDGFDPQYSPAHLHVDSDNNSIYPYVKNPPPISLHYNISQPVSHHSPTSTLSSQPLLAHSHLTSLSTLASNRVSSSLGNSLGNVNSRSVASMCSNSSRELSEYNSEFNQSNHDLNRESSSDLTVRNKENLSVRTDSTVYSNSDLNSNPPPTQPNPTDSELHSTSINNQTSLSSIVAPASPRFGALGWSGSTPNFGSPYPTSPPTYPINPSSLTTSSLSLVPTALSDVDPSRLPVSPLSSPHPSLAAVAVHAGEGESEKEREKEKPSSRPPRPLSNAKGNKFSQDSLFSSNTYPLTATSMCVVNEDFAPVSQPTRGQSTASSNKHPLTAKLTGIAERGGVAFINQPLDRDEVTNYENDFSPHARVSRLNNVSLLNSHSTHSIRSRVSPQSDPNLTVQELLQQSVDIAILKSLLSVTKNTHLQMDSLAETAFSELIFTLMNRTNSPSNDRAHLLPHNMYVGGLTKINESLDYNPQFQKVKDVYYSKYNTPANDEWGYTDSDDDDEHSRKDPVDHSWVTIPSHYQHPQSGETSEKSPVGLSRSRRNPLPSNIFNTNFRTVHTMREEEIVAMQNQLSQEEKAQMERERIERERQEQSKRLEEARLKEIERKNQERLRLLALDESPPLSLANQVKQLTSAESHEASWLAASVGVSGVDRVILSDDLSLTHMEALVAAEEAELAEEERQVVALEKHCYSMYNSLARSAKTAIEYKEREHWDSMLHYNTVLDELNYVQLHLKHRERYLLHELVHLISVTSISADDCRGDLVESILANEKIDINNKKRSQYESAINQRLGVYFTSCHNQLWQIRGIPLMTSRLVLQILPPAMLDDMATGLGYVAQLLLLFAKYTRCQMIYPLTYCGNKTVIWKNETQYPLYVQSGQEHRFLEGVTLLNLNVIHFIGIRLPSELAVTARPQCHHLLENIHLLMQYEVPSN